MLSLEDIIVNARIDFCSCLRVLAVCTVAQHLVAITSSAVFRSQPFRGWDFLSGRKCKWGFVLKP